MSNGRRWALPALLGSVACNGVALALLIAKARRSGGTSYVARKLKLRAPALQDYTDVAEQRFGWIPRSCDDVVFIGDSHIQYAPLADLVTNVKQLGIGGQSVADVRSWVGQVLSTPPRQLVLLAGTRDVINKRSPMDFARDYDDLLAEIAHRAPDTRVVVLTVPPLAGPAARRVVEFNVALKQVVDRHDFRIVDLHGPLSHASGALNAEYSDDGVHLNAQGYARAAPVFTRAAADG